MAPAVVLAQFYRRLLDLRHQNSLDVLLQDALGLAVEITQARVGWLELRDVTGAQQFLKVAGGTEAKVRARISQTIVEEALRCGHPVVSASAMSDAKFATSDSVRQNEISSVLCAPLFVEVPIGFLFLEGARSPRGFDADDVDNMMLFARELEVAANRLVRTTERPLSELSRDYELKQIRDAINRHNGNKSSAARELGVDRAWMYRRLGDE